jgi:hypothetical protein
MVVGVAIIAVSAVVAVVAGRKAAAAVARTTAPELAPATVAGPGA